MCYFARMEEPQIPGIEQVMAALRETRPWTEYDNVEEAYIDGFKHALNWYIMKESIEEEDNG